MLALLYLIYEPLKLSKLKIILYSLLIMHIQLQNLPQLPRSQLFPWAAPPAALCVSCGACAALLSV